MLKGVLKALGLDPNERLVDRYRSTASDIEVLEKTVREMSDETLEGSAKFFAARLSDGESPAGDRKSVV